MNDDIHVTDINLMTLEINSLHLATVNLLQTIWEKNLRKLSGLLQYNILIMVNTIFNMLMVKSRLGKLKQIQNN